MGAIVSFVPGIGPWIGIPLMIGGGIWSAYDMRMKQREAMERANRNRGGLKLNTKTTQTAIPVVYGLTRSGGNIIYQHTGGKRDSDGQQRNRYFHNIIGISEGPIENFVGAYLSDTKFWQINSGDTNISSGYLDTPYKRQFTYNNPEGYPYAELDFRLGCNSQEVFTQIHSITNNWGWDLDGNWVKAFDPSFSERYPLTACAYVRLYYPSLGPGEEPMWQAVPTMTFDVMGKRVRDICNDVNQYVWTDNPAYILFDVMTNKQYGWSIPSSKIDLASFQSVASFCAGSGSGWSSAEVVFGDAPQPYEQSCITNSVTMANYDSEDPQPIYASVDPANFALLSTAGRYTYGTYDPSSFSVLPMAVQSLSITVTTSWTAIYEISDQDWSRVWATYGLYADADGYLYFAGYTALGGDLRTTLVATADYMPVQNNYFGGDVASGTIVGSIDFATGSMSWLTNSIHGMRDYDPMSEQYIYNTKANVGKPSISVQWYNGYGGSFTAAQGQFQMGNVTIVATMSDNSVEILTETSSGSGILMSSSLSGGRSLGGGSIDYETGAVTYYFSSAPQNPPSMSYAYWLNMGYSYNGIILDSQPAADLIRDICQHFRGYLTYKQGIYHLNVDKIDTPVYSFDEDNIKKGSFVIRQTPISERPNRIRVKYTDREQNYTAMDVVYEPPNPIIDPEDVVIEHTITLEKCVYKDQAYRMAQTLGRQAQLGNNCEFVTGQDGLNVDIGDLVYVTWPPASWVDKKFRVVEMEERPEEEVFMSLQEYDESVYADEYTG